MPEKGVLYFPEITPQKKGIVKRSWCDYGPSPIPKTGERGKPGLRFWGFWAQQGYVPLMGRSPPVTDLVTMLCQKAGRATWATPEAWPWVRKQQETPGTLQALASPGLCQLTTLPHLILTIPLEVQSCPRLVHFCGVRQISPERVGHLPEVTQWQNWKQPAGICLPQPSPSPDPQSWKGSWKPQPRAQADEETRLSFLEVTTCPSSLCPPPRTRQEDCWKEQVFSPKACPLPCTCSL